LSYVLLYNWLGQSKTQTNPNPIPGIDVVQWEKWGNPDVLNGIGWVSFMST